MRKAITWPLSVLLTTAVALAQRGPESNAGSDHSSSSFQEGERMEMEAFVVTATRIGGRPWRYVSIPGFEILSRCADYQTEDYIRAIMRGTTLEKIMLPDGCLASLASPAPVILYDGDSSGNSSVSSFAPKSVSYGQSDAAFWGNYLNSVFHVPSVTNDVDTVVDCVRLGSDGFNLGSDGSPVPAWLQKTAGFRLRRRVPQYPLWFIVGLTGEDGVYNRGQSIQYDDHRMPVGMLIPTARWISESETLSVRKQVAGVFPIPLKDLFDPGNPGQWHQSSVWQSEAALFVRWGMFYVPKKMGQFAPPEADHRPQFWKLVDQATAGPITEDMFRKCFGFGFDTLKFKLERYGPDANNPNVTGHINGPQLTLPGRNLKLDLGGFVGATYGRTF